jgi:GT2 family glycosyltransferase
MTFSIIIPTRDRPRQLIECLESVARLRCEKTSLEVIVIDDGGEGSLEEVVARFRDRLDLSLCEQQENRGPAAARNAGAERAAGSVLAFTDDDCILAEDWLEKVATKLASADGTIVGGRTVNAQTKNIFCMASQCLIDYLYEYYNDDENDARFLTSNNMAIPTRQFLEVGGFDPQFPKAAAEDRDLCDRWRMSGRRMVYDPKAVVFHKHHLGPRRFWKQHFNYGRGAHRFQRERARRSGEGHRFEPFKFYSEMLSYPFRAGQGARSPILTMLLVLTQVANAAGFFLEKARHAARRSRR